MGGDDKETLGCIYPTADSPKVVVYVANLAWFMQCVMLPMSLVSSIPTILATSGDSIDVVMNALAITFIIEIDNMLYNALLTGTQRSEYQSAAAMSGDTARRSSLVLGGPVHLA